MTQISIERLREEFTYDAETGVIVRHKGAQKSRRKPGSPVEHIDPEGYVAVCLDRKKMKGHRVAWAMHHGEWPTMPLDHINGDKRDNRIVNLRLADHSQNGANTLLRSGNKYGVKGVTLLASGKWQAQIRVRGKSQYLGSFETKEEAGEAYAQAARAGFGEYCGLNRAAEGSP